jgi:hypothetical protein
LASGASVAGGVAGTIPLLAERARESCARSTRAVGTIPAIPSETVGGTAHWTPGVVEVGFWCDRNWRVAHP